MELNKFQTIRLFLNAEKEKSFNFRYKFATKTKWYCISCMKPLYISYKQSGLYSIFCKSCYSIYVNKQTIAQAMYLKKLKETQLKMMNSFLDI